MLQTLSTIVESIYEGHGLMPYLEELGADHKGYRVKNHHYAYFGEALVLPSSNISAAAGRTVCFSPFTRFSAANNAQNGMRP